MFFVLLLACLTVSCAGKITAERTITLKSNLSKPQLYSVNVSVAEGDDTWLHVDVFSNGARVTTFEMSSKAITFTLRAVPQEAPFTLIKGKKVSGTVSFKPAAGTGPVVSLPYSIYIRPWIVTNYWIFIVILAGFSVLLLINILCLLLKPAARGKVEVIDPSILPWYIFPRSKVVHCRRNIFTIGSDKHDTCMIENCKGLKGGHLVLSYFWKRKGMHRALAVHLQSKSFFYYKKEEFVRDMEYREGNEPFPQLLPDYYLKRDSSGYFQNLSELQENRGYQGSFTVEMQQGDSVILVLRESIVIRLSI